MQLAVFPLGHCSLWRGLREEERKRRREDSELVTSNINYKAAYGPVLRGTLSRKRYAQRRQVTAWAIATLARRLLTIWVSEALRPIVTPKG